MSITSKIFEEEKVTSVSLPVQQTAVEWRAGTQTKTDVTETEDAAATAGNQSSAGHATGNQSSVATGRPAVELPAEDEFPPPTLGSVPRGSYTLHLVEPVTFPPPPPSPLPPLPPLPSLPGSAGAPFSRPPRYTNSPAGATSVRAGYSISLGAGNAGSSVDANDGKTAAISAGNAAVTNEGNSGIVSACDNAGVNTGNSAGANAGNNASAIQSQSVVLLRTPAQPTATTDHVDSPAVNQATLIPPPQRPPPPPPPPLPLGSYHSIRYFKCLHT